MSIIVWDGKILAADRSITSGDVKVEFRKLWEIDDGAIAGCGDMVSVETMRKWWMSGGDINEWPECQNDAAKWATLVVVKHNDGIFYYEDKPISLPVYGFMAWGSGADIAIGALAAGANSIEAVMITCNHSPYCGLGCDSVKIY